ncbi:MAG: hypothetical protein IAF38_22385 [Bacteroidia bacterium]|nr:hypothetical protein [Bacteroidia bacterium]
MKADFVFVCTEGWENMKPTEKGAFCGVCNKEVIDFSRKNLKQVKETLMQEKSEGELCGRFKPHQLLELNFTSFFKKFTLWNIRKRLTLIFFFVLGGMMFSCSSFIGGGREPEHLAGAIAYVPDSTEVKRNDSIMKAQLEKAGKDSIKKGN